MACREVWLTSTPYCLLPVTRIDGAAIGEGVPGAGFQAMIERWSNQVGVDIVAQAERHGSLG
jgi:branched-chain amino acid aminotransferase